MALLARFDGSTLPAPEMMTGSHPTLLTVASDPLPAHRLYSPRGLVHRIQRNSSQTCFVTLSSTISVGTLTFDHAVPANALFVTSIARMGNVSINRHTTNGQVRVVFTGGVTHTVNIPFGWNRFEIACSSSTAAHVRIWSLDQVTGEPTALLFDQAGTMTARAGAWYGIGTNPTSTQAAAYFGNVTLTDTVEPAPLPSRFKDSDSAPLNIRGLWDGTQILPCVPIGVQTAGTTNKVYFDTAPVRSAIAAATTYAEIATALTPLTSAYQVTISPQETADSASFFYGDVPFSDPKMKPALYEIVEALAQYPLEFFMNAARTAPRGFTFRYGRDLRISNSEVSGRAAGVGIQINIKSTDTALATLHPVEATCIRFTVHHEIAHAMENHTTGGDTTNAMIAALQACNPPGFTYGNTQDPYEGAHPEGFLRYYSQTIRSEDIADLWGMIMTPDFFVDRRAWIDSDSRLGRKVRVIADWMSDANIQTPPYFTFETTGSQTHLGPV